MLVRQVVESAEGQNWQYFYAKEQLCPFFWHYHPEFELTFTQHAHGIRYIGSDTAKFSSQDLALVAPNQPHSWHMAPEGGLKEIQVAFFSLGWLQNLANQGAPELLPLCYWLAQIRVGVVFSQKITRQLKPRFAKLHQLRGLARLSCLLDILSCLQQDTNMRMLQGFQAVEIQDRRLNAALVYLQNHFAEAVTLAHLADAASASTTTIKRLFSKQMNTNFSALLCQQRIGHACQLLLTSEQAIPAIGQASGFPTLSQFYRQFAILKNCSPASYRKQYRLPKQ